MQELNITKSKLEMIEIYKCVYNKNGFFDIIILIEKRGVSFNGIYREYSK